MAPTLWLFLSLASFLILIALRWSLWKRLSWRQILSLAPVAWLVGAQSAATVLALTAIYEEELGQHLEFNDGVDGIVFFALILTLIVRLLLPQAEIRDSRFERELTWRTVVVLCAAAIALTLIQVLDEIILSDSLDFNDSGEGIVLMFGALMLTGWITASRLYRHGVRVIGQPILRDFVAATVLTLLLPLCLKPLVSWLSQISNLGLRVDYDFLVAFALVAGLSLVITRHRLRERSHRKRPKSPVKQLVLSLRDRAQLFRATAYIALMLTFATLSFALLVFVFAGTITAQEQGARLISRATAVSDELQLRLDRALAPLPPPARSRLLENLYRIDPREWGGEIYRILGDLESGYDITLLVQLDRVAEEYVAQGGRVGKLEEPEAPPVNTPRDPSESLIPLIAELPTTLTRIGAVALAVFLTQILVSLYRYASRMAAFCDGRADAISVYENKGSDAQLGILVEALAGEKVAFGKEPSSPMQHFVEMVRELNRLGWRPPG